MPRAYALLLAGAVALLVACDGGEDGGLIAIDRFSGVAEPLTIQELYDPPFAADYPAVVAEVSGEPILGEDLAVRVAQQILGRWEYESGVVAGQSRAPQEFIDEQLRELEAIDPLESLIDRELLRQAAEERGLTPSYDEAADYTREQEQIFLSIDPSNTIDEVFTRLSWFQAIGYPLKDWASDPEMVEMHRATLGTAELRRAECAPGRNAEGEISDLVALDCSELLAELRAEAEIVYFVRWK